MLRRNYRTFASLLITAIVLACAFAPASAPVPAFDPNSINTVIVQTADAASTQTAFFITPTETPTSTLTATAVPTETQTPTPTFVFLLPTPTVATATRELGTSGLEYDCQIISKTPADGAVFAVNKEFVMTWQVANAGTAIWDANNADYRYKSGDKLHTADVYDFETSLSPGQNAEVKVKMRTPSTGGTFSTTWVIKTGKTSFCEMTISILVNQ